MIYHIAQAAQKYVHVFNVFHYVSFRAICALLSTLGVSLMFGNKFIDASRQYFKSPRREWSPKGHEKKVGIPTMGGLFIIAVVVLNTLIWANVCNVYVWICLLCYVLFGFIGFIDDIFKIRYKKGISATVKCGLQIMAASVIGMLIVSTPFSKVIYLPFFKQAYFYIGSFLYVIWIVFILVGTSNAVNLTDGLDGLAITSLLPNFTVFSIVCYLAGHAYFAKYLHIPFAGTAELAVLGAAFIGASLGFLWFNTFPAHIFMGDVGSLSFGAVLGVMAILAKQEFLLLISGGLFVVETISVIVQVCSYKIFKQKFFRMAPIHHHYELLGCQESQVAIRFGIISCVLCLLALMTLKMR